MVPDRAIFHSCHCGERALSLLRLSCARLVTPVPFRPTLQHPGCGHPEAEGSGRATPHRGFGTGGHQNRDCE